MRAFVRRLLLSWTVACIVVAACRNATEPQEAACTNLLAPPSFRIVMLSGDTTPRVANRYLLPHRSVDTLRLPLSDGSGSALVVDTYQPGYCITVFDSTLLHTRKADKWID